MAVEPAARALTGWIPRTPLLIPARRGGGGTGATRSRSLADTQVTTKHGRGPLTSFHTYTSSPLLPTSS